MKNNEKRGKPTKWNLSFQRAAIDLTLDCCEIWQRFKTRDVEKTNKSKRERERQRTCRKHQFTMIRMYRQPFISVWRKIPSQEKYRSTWIQQPNDPLVDFRNGIIARWAREIMSHDLATTRTYHANGNKQNFTWFYGASDNWAGSETISYIWRLFSLRNKCAIPSLIRSYSMVSLGLVFSTREKNVISNVLL